jgi:hypothetical protein
MDGLTGRPDFHLEASVTEAVDEDGATALAEDVA